ncbi:TRP-domain-containing protein [Aulographum hederae CBS 113979]|uniref:TRP-domain-containing protein n=1 Tax=Aulographum hederae CBS 113979 TaxID=1176131 RepID=A0A6G1GPG0_9PEZI|nr:TRP-domain-containing protein [Aulographum hederae CBS 113979]
MSPFTLVLSALLYLLPVANARNMLLSTSLNPCMDNSHFSATLFNVVFTPDNGLLSFDINGISAISGNVTAELLVYAYGYKILNKELNPCDNDDLKGLCPMNTGQIDLNSSTTLSQDVVKQVPGIAYTVPDLDGRVQIYINDTETGAALACVEAEMSNGKTVYQKGVGWTTAVIAGIGLVASAVSSGLGHSNTAAHVAANALSLFGYFQAQAFIGMSAVELPPVVSAWTQNFQWSMGIIRIGFLQDMATWYQRSTGGTPSSLLSSLSTTSVEVQKRSLDAMSMLVAESYSSMFKRDLYGRTNADNTNAETLSVITVRGIKRVGFNAKIEITNIFLTGYAFFIIFVMFVSLGVILFKLACEALVKAGKMKGDKFVDFRNGWHTVLKGILFRIVLIGFPQMVVLCFWELTVRDSSAEVVLAIFTIVTMLMILSWASFKVWRIAQRSIEMHKNPAYILYSDPVALNKWGFLYVQFKATAYYFIIPVLLYLLVKGLFIALSQGSGVTQAVALVILEATLLVSVSVLRPYMDKKTNGFNIAITAVNFISAIFLLVFSNVFNQPGIVTGVMGVIFFVYNAAFALILLLMVLVASGYALFTKNPDTRYQPMRDDRGSFIKSQTNINTELDALGATARGDNKHPGAFGKPRSAIDDDDDSSLSSETGGQTMQMNHLNQPPLGANAQRGPSPVDPSVPLFPGSGQEGRTQPPGYYSPQRSMNGSPAPGAGYRPGTGNRSQMGSRGNGGASPSPWQRGAGYE